MATDEVIVIAVNWYTRVVVLADGRTGELTDYFDAEGDETNNIDDIAFAVARITDDCWITLQRSDWITQRSY